ncbi:hypothetical protein [Catenulispora pinistramenti]|nr:hypothetical protein [Catenulispora pinistramenti]
MNDERNEPETPDQVELDILALVEIWRALDFPEPATWTNAAS